MLDKSTNFNKNTEHLLCGRYSFYEIKKTWLAFMRTNLNSYCSVKNGYYRKICSFFSNLFFAAVIVV